MSESILDIYQRLYDAYGPQGWWPADDRFEVIVGAVLTQNTSWRNVEKAIWNLRAAGVLSPHGLRESLESDLARLVYPSGYYNTKARKLQAFARYVGDRYGDDLDALASCDAATLRGELLEVYGIGEETADDILLYALGKPVFVVDAFTKRLFYRLGLAAESGPYSEYQAMFEKNLAPDAALFEEYHALIVRQAGEVCRKTRPLCEGCVLLDICPTGQAHTNSF